MHGQMQLGCGDKIVEVNHRNDECVHAECRHVVQKPVDELGDGQVFDWRRCKAIVDHRAFRIILHHKLDQPNDPHTRFCVKFAVGGHLEL